MHILAIIFIILYILWFIGKYKEIKEKLQAEGLEECNKYCRYVKDRYYGCATYGGMGDLGGMARDFMNRYRREQC